MAGEKAESEAPLVHVVDDDPSLAAGLQSLFGSVGIEARTYGSAVDFVAAPRPDRPGCVVLDVRLPGMSGLDFQTEVARLGIALPIVLMTGHGDIPMSVRGMKAGAVDFLAKPFRDQDMLDAVATALDRDRQRRKAAQDAAQLQARYGTLSARERQVMAMVTAGLMNKQVAGHLQLSEITVKIHRGATMRKMGARTLPDLVRMAEALGVRPV